MESFDLIADSHAHIYPFMSVHILLEAARRKLFEGRGQAPGGEFGLLLIADPEGVRGFERLLEYGKQGRSPDERKPWLRESGDGCSVVIQWPSGTRIIAIRR